MRISEKLGKMHVSDGDKRRLEVLLLMTSILGFLSMASIYLLFI